MTRVLMRFLDPTFGHPRGRMGSLGGRLMARGNAEQERWAVSKAALQQGEHVLVVGPGPGVGLSLAAAAVGPSGRVLGVDPSDAMRQMAAARCAADIERGVVALRAGGAEDTGAETGAFDAAISVNSVMLWDLDEGFREIARALRSGGRLVVTVHRHVLGMAPEQLRAHAEAAGFGDVALDVRPRRMNSPAVELSAFRS